MPKPRQALLLLIRQPDGLTARPGAKRLKDVFVQEPAVQRQAAEHEAVHGHPADEGRGGAFVDAIDAFFAQGLEDAVEGAGELGFWCGLEAHFYCVEGVSTPHKLDTDVDLVICCGGV